MKKENFISEIQAEAFKLWLSLHQDEVKKRGRGLLSILIIVLVGTIFFLAIAPRPASYEIIAIHVCIILISFTLLVLGFISITEPISPTSWIARLHRRKGRIMISLVLNNLWDKYQLDAQCWTGKGYKITLYHIFERNFQDLIYNEIADYSGFGEKAQELEVAWRTAAGDRLTEIRNLLNISDQFFEQPEEILIEIEIIDEIIRQPRANVQEVEKNDKTIVLINELKELSAIVDKIPEFYHDRDLTFEENGQVFAHVYEPC